MSNELKNAIRTALAGSGSEQRVVSGVMINTIIRAGQKITQDDLMNSVEEMLQTRELSMDRDGSKVLYWLTRGSTTAPVAPARQHIEESVRRVTFDDRPPFVGAIVNIPGLEAKAATSSRSGSARHNPASGEARPTTPAKPKATLILKENAMLQKPKQSRTSEVVLAILALTGEQPGIERKALAAAALKRAPQATAEQADKAISNLQHASKRIRMENIDGDRCYFLNDGKAKAAKKPVAKQAEKPAKAKKSKRVGASSLAKPIAAKAAPTKTSGEDDGFRILMDEDANIHISTGFASVAVLTPAQAMRAQRFINRIWPV